MSIEIVISIVGLISSCLGGVIVAFINSSAKNTITDKQIKNSQENQYYKDLSHQISNLRNRIGNLEERVEHWKGNYWSLYAWLTAFVAKHDIEEMPPSFHKNEAEE